MSPQADRLADGMRRADIDVRPENPFLGQDISVAPGAPPIANLLRAIWSRDRCKVETILPAPSGPRDVADVLAQIDEVYVHDAWNSLSIEGYRVTTALIEKVREGRWDPGEDTSDRDAMAAKGYWNVFQAVKDVVETSVRRTTPVSPRAHLDDWHQELFEPSVAAGIVTRAQLAGYRNHPVFIRSAQHVPPAAEKLMDAMDAWFDLMDEEPHPGVRAVLGHWLLGYVHPFPDGNGRLARFVMNAVLASSGYGWVVIRLDERARYMAALDSASAQDEIEPFARLIAEHLSAGR
jgi:Fic family protein